MRERGAHVEEVRGSAACSDMRGGAVEELECGVRLPVEIVQGEPEPSQVHHVAHAQCPRVVEARPADRWREVPLTLRSVASLQGGGRGCGVGGDNVGKCAMHAAMPCLQLGADGREVPLADEPRKVARALQHGAERGSAAGAAPPTCRHARLRHAGAAAGRPILVGALLDPRVP